MSFHSEEPGDEYGFEDRENMEREQKALQRTEMIALKWAVECSKSLQHAESGSDLEREILVHHIIAAIKEAALVQSEKPTVPMEFYDQEKFLEIHKRADVLFANMAGDVCEARYTSPLKRAYDDNIP